MIIIIGVFIIVCLCILAFIKLCIEMFIGVFIVLPIQILFGHNKEIYSSRYETNRLLSEILERIKH